MTDHIVETTNMVNLTEGLKQVKKDFEDGYFSAINACFNDLIVRAQELEVALSRISAIDIDTVSEDLEELMKALLLCGDIARETEKKP